MTAWNDSAISQQFGEILRNPVCVLLKCGISKLHKTSKIKDKKRESVGKELSKIQF